MENLKLNERLHEVLKKMEETRKARIQDEIKAAEQRIAKILAELKGERE